MISPSIKLYRLRGWFVIYYVLKSVVGAAVAMIVLKPENLGRVGAQDFSGASLLVFSLLVAAVILAIALIIFAQLLLRRNWARVLLLVLGWLTVIGAVFSLLASTQIVNMGSWMSRLVPEMDWEKLMNFDRLQKVFELLFWGYLIAVLQFADEVKKEFFLPLPVEKSQEK
jgi:glucan phosphoethanolaminetransferase (alkaline phosphatase superfamily)